MAVGDSYFDCNNNILSLPQVIKDMIYDDGEGNPVININPEGSTLEPFFTCENKEISIEQILRDLIVQDENGNPVFNIAQS